MKFLVDVHVAASIARALERISSDVVRASVTHPIWDDSDLLAHAVREKRFIITQDGDFTDLIFAFAAPAPPGLIYIRCEPDQQRGLVDHIMDVVADARLNGHIAVITPANIRYRPFPKVSNDNA